jgi:hypothetical protein
MNFYELRLSSNLYDIEAAAEGQQIYPHISQKDFFLSILLFELYVT